MATLGRGACLALLILTICTLGADKNSENTKGEIKTRYDLNGRPVNQGLERKGMHSVVGTATLASGTVTLKLNTSTQRGKQDVSFIDSSTYTGKAWTLYPGDTAVYKMLAVSGTEFIIKVIRGSEWSDTARVYFQLEGE